jgi:nicotinamidase-related amidase
MTQLNVPIRYYQDYEGGYDYAYEGLELSLERTCFLLVDVDGGYSIRADGTPHPTTEQFIAPALAAARRVGMKVAYVHNDLRLVAGQGNRAQEFWSKSKLPPGSPPMGEGWSDPDFAPKYLDSVAPREGEPNFPKWMWSGFRDTFLNQRLRSWDIENLIVVGYSRRACMHYTCSEAVALNYRLVLLRDCSNPPGEIEMPDTLDDSLPEGGWVNRMMLRNFEHLLGYTSTSAEFVAACAG